MSLWDVIKVVGGARPLTTVPAATNYDNDAKDGLVSRMVLMFLLLLAVFFFTFQNEGIGAPASK